MGIQSEKVLELIKMGNSQVLKYIINTLKVIGALFCLYCFICSLDILSTAFKLLAGQATGDIFSGGWLTNPVIGLMIGILGTVLVQSSSTFTSIIVAAIGAGMDIHIAIPMLMGANIGTSVTNTLVAMTQIGNKDEFQRAFSAATVHDMFNWCTVLIVFTIECLFGVGFLEKMTDAMADNLVGSNVTGTKIKILGYITDPVVDSIIEIDKGVLKKWAANQSCPDCRLIVNCTDKEDCGYLFNLPSLSDQAIGGILLCLSLVVLCSALFFLVKTLNSLLKGSMAEAVKRVVNPKFKNPLVAYLFGILLIFIGAGATIILQSSSIFTSTLTPMVGMGYVELETCYPMFLGSNIGTTFTSMLAALTQSGTDNFKNTIQGALVHLFFNIIGILLFYPIPFMRFPLPMCKRLGKLTAKYRWFAVVYIIVMFFVVPGIFVALSLIDAKGIAMYTFLGISIFIAILGALLKVIQSKDSLKPYLPESLHTFEFLPKPLRSLEPYDKKLTGFPCCKIYSADPEDQPMSMVANKKPESIGATNPTFTVQDE